MHTIGPAGENFPKVAAGCSRAAPRAAGLAALWGKDRGIASSKRGAVAARGMPAVTRRGHK